jgi:anti-anti-sigma factor
MSVPTPHPVAAPAEFSISEEQFAPAGVVFSVTGELDIATTSKLRRSLGAALDRGVRRVVIDLRPLDFLDSIAVAALLHVAQRLRGEGSVAVVVDPDSYIRMVFEIAGLPQCLDVVETRSQAIERVSA